VHPDLHHLLHLQREAEIVREAELRRQVAERAAEGGAVVPDRTRRRRPWRSVLTRAARVPATGSHRHLPAR
jgi:hypothetical protein